MGQEINFSEGVSELIVGSGTKDVGVAQIHFHSQRSERRDQRDSKFLYDIIKLSTKHIQKAHKHAQKLWSAYIYSWSQEY